MRAVLALSVFVLGLLLSPVLTAAQCGVTGLDVSSLTGTAMVAFIGGYLWSVNPCGTVAGVQGISCAGQVCQGNTVVSSYAPGNVTWIPADNGLVQESQNGAPCGDDGLIQNTLRFVCNTSATTPIISDAEMDPVCHYLIIVQTSLVCTPPSSLRSVGSTYVSDLCGGGAYSLAQLAEDIFFIPTSASYTGVWINPCFTVQNSSCGSPYYQGGAYISVCQAYLPLPPTANNAFNIAVYDPTQSAVQYTLLSNGIVQYYQDGAYWGGFPRAMNITYLCNQGGSTYGVPSSWQATETAAGQLVYSATIMTPVVCGAAYQPPACGGAGYNLSSISGAQMSLANFNGYNWYVAPCGNTLASASGGCVGQACQGSTTLGAYDPNTAIWTPADNGVVQQVQDGLGCGGDGPRQTTLRFICNTTAITPFIVSAFEWPQCHYTFAIQTAAACPVQLGSAPAVGTSFISDLCGGGIYNLNKVSPGADIQYIDGAGGGVLFFNPCGPVSTSACNGVSQDIIPASTAVDGVAAVCYSTNVSSSNSYTTYATWNPEASPIRYSRLTSTGVLQTHIDGSYCGSTVRVVTINYVCSSTALSAVVTSFVNSDVACQTNITVATVAVCGAAFTFPACGGAGFDLSKTLAGVELSGVPADYNSDTYAVYTVNVCGSVAGSQSTTLGCNAQVCQTGYNLSYYDSSAQWIPADYGVVQITQNGQTCGGDNARYVSLRFICNALATTPFISDAGEEPSCHYNVDIQSSAVCSLPAGFQSSGNTWISEQCGGGAYNLALISGFGDLVYPQGSPTYAYGFFNPCGMVQNASCGSADGPQYQSFCEAYTPLNYTNPSNEYRIAVYDPVRAPVSYTVIPNGLTQYYAAGDFTGGYPRAINVSYLCQSSASTPYIAGYTSASVDMPGAAGSYQTIYQLTVMTDVVCGAPFAKMACGSGSVDFSSLVGTVFTGAFNSGPQYQFAPCSSVHAPGTAPSNGLGGCTAQACQSTYPLSYYNPATTVWYPADYGLVQMNQDGVMCGTAYPRALTVRWVCNPSATTAYLSNAVQDPECWYTLTMQTSLACNSIGLPAALPMTVGSVFASDKCGGGAYLLTGVSNGADIVVANSDGSLTFVNPCGPVQNISCSGSNVVSFNSAPAVCQVYPINNAFNWSQASSNAYAIATWNPSQAPILYSLLSNGISQLHQDGTMCNGFLRVTTINYLCLSTAIAPVITSYVVSSTCNYTITIQTAAVCNAPGVFTCKANGYDLTAIAGSTVSAYLDDYYWSVAPCGNVSNPYFPSCTGQVCQNTIGASYFDPALSSWTYADNGLLQQLQNGDACGGDGLRQTSLRFVCNSAAVTPYLSAAGANPTCHYTLYLQTNAVCPVNTTFRTQPLTPYVSDLCGGGAYNLALAFGQNDLVYYLDSPGNPSYVFLNPCGTVQNVTCSTLGYTSVCQAYVNTSSGAFYTPVGDQAYQLGIYDPARSPVTYTVLPNGGGLIQSYDDGAYNGGNPRSMTITYSCNSLAALPVFNGFSVFTVNIPGGAGAFQTYYNLSVSTLAVCGAPFSLTSSCGTAAYNLSALVGTTLSYVDSSGNEYFVSPCGQVDAPDAAGCTGQVCQGSTTVSRYVPSITEWVQADNGVLAITQDGSACSVNGLPITSIVRYVCEASGAAQIISATDTPQCRYTIEVQTSAVCGVAISQAVGTSFYSDTCGGGAWALTSLSTSDITAVVDGGNYLFINPCGPVKNSSCAISSGLPTPASVCYVYAPLAAPYNDYLLASYNPVAAPILYTVTSSGLLATHQDGGYCGSGPSVRTVYIMYLCFLGASTPAVTGYSSANCVYNITISTSVTCSAPFSTPVSSSSAASAAPVVSSSAASVVSSSAASAVSSSASSVISSPAASVVSSSASPVLSSSAASATAVTGSGGGTGATSAALPASSSGGSQSHSGGGSGLSGGAIAGIVIGSVAGALLILLLLLWFLCSNSNRRGKNQSYDDRQKPEQPSHSHIEMSNVDDSVHGADEQETTAQ